MWFFVARAYAFANAIFRPHETLMNDILEWVMKRDPDQILELGVGHGPVLEHLRNNGWNGRYIGNDWSSSMLNLARKRNPGALFQQTDYLTFLQNLPSNSFECIIASNSLYMLEGEYALAVLDEIKRVLKPGGKVFTSHLHSTNFLHFMEIHLNMPGTTTKMSSEKAALKGFWLIFRKEFLNACRMLFMVPYFALMGDQPIPYGKEKWLDLFQSRFTNVEMISMTRHVNFKESGVNDVGTIYIFEKPETKEEAKR